MIFLVGFIKSIKYCNHFTNYSLVTNPDSAISIMLPVGVPKSKWGAIHILLKINIGETYVFDAQQIIVVFVPLSLLTVWSIFHSFLSNYLWQCSQKSAHFEPIFAEAIVPSLSVVGG